MFRVGDVVKMTWVSDLQQVRTLCTDFGVIRAIETGNESLVWNNRTRIVVNHHRYVEMDTFKYHPGALTRLPFRAH